MEPTSLHRWSYPPCDYLAPYIDRYWGWTIPPGTRMPLIIPGTGSEYFFYFKTSLPSVCGQSLPAAHLICPRYQTRQAPVHDAQALLAVRFKSGQLRHFTALPFSELQDQFHSLHSLWPDTATALLEQLGEVTHPLQRIQLLERFFSAQLTIYRHPEDQSLDQLIQRLYYSPNQSIDDWATQSGWSRRHLERRFKQTYAMSPKHFARLSRLKHSLRQIALQPLAALADVAQERGYSDQAHFIHDSRRLTGLTPRQLQQQLLTGLNYYYPPSRQPV